MPPTRRRYPRRAGSAPFRGARGGAIAELPNDGIRIRVLTEIVARVQRRARELLSGKPRASVDDFIRVRRVEAKHE